MPSQPASRAVQRLRLSLIITLAAAPIGMSGSERVERRLVTMGTVLRLEVAGPDLSAALEASEAAAREIERIERLLSTWKRGGVLDRLNASAPGSAVAVGPETARVLAEVLSWSERTDRAFDPTVLPLVLAWDLRGGGRIPAPGSLVRALAAMGPHAFAVEPGTGTAWRCDPDAGIDEGAWGKGYALDHAAAAALNAGALDLLLDLGGQVFVRGRRTIAIADPRHRDRRAAYVEVENGSVSTSGDSERSVVVAGRHIGHLLDPRTGLPANDFGSATVVAATGLTADVLSTAFFVLGPERGLALSAALSRQGLPNEVLFLIAQRDSRVRPLASPGLTFHIEESKP